LSIREKKSLKNAVFWAFWGKKGLKLQIYIIIRTDMGFFVN